MAASITKAGESLIAQKQAAGEVLEVVRFVLALVPGLDPNGPVDRDAPKPPAEQLVYTQAYTQKGFVNPNQVVYSLMMGSDIGDFDWNWIGLETAENVLLSVAYVPIQQKRKNTPPHQIGNNVTRNFLVAFDGAQALTAITVDASTWQHDFTVRLAGIDERERLSNRDLFGRACFFGDALALTHNGIAFQLNAGKAYIEGIRVKLAEPYHIAVPIPEGYVWLDVCLGRELNDTVVSWSIQFGEWEDYIDSAGQRHYCVPIAHFLTYTQITDLRVTEPITGTVIQHLAARAGDYPELRARATTKEDVKLDQIPNAISDDPATNSSEILATTAALNRLKQQVEDSLTGLVATFAMQTAPEGWVKCNFAALSRTTFAKLFARIGTTYGAGDGVTTFNIPDARGLTPRYWDDGRGVDAGRVFGSFQEMMIQSHGHGASADAVGDHVHGAWTDTQGHHDHPAWADAQGNHQHTAPRAHNNNVGGGSPNFTTANLHNGSTAPTDWAGQHSHNIAVGGAGNHAHNVGIGGGGGHSHTIHIAADGGYETRSKNIAFLCCIKY